MPVLPALLAATCTNFARAEAQPFGGSTRRRNGIGSRDSEHADIVTLPIDVGGTSREESAESFYEWPTMRSERFGRVPDPHQWSRNRSRSGTLGIATGGSGGAAPRQKR